MQMRCGPGFTLITIVDESVRRIKQYDGPAGRYWGRLGFPSLSIPLFSAGQWLRLSNVTFPKMKSYTAVNFPQTQRKQKEKIIGKL